MDETNVIPADRTRLYMCAQPTSVGDISTKRLLHMGAGKEGEGTTEKRGFRLHTD